MPSGWCDVCAVLKLVCYTLCANIQKNKIGAPKGIEKPFGVNYAGKSEIATLRCISHKVYYHHRTATF